MVDPNGYSIARGDIRVRRKPGSTQVSEYTLEVRTDKGWASVDIELNID